MKKFRFLSLCMAVVLLLGMMPGIAHAAGETPQINVSLTLHDRIAINVKVSANDIASADFQKVEFCNGEEVLKTVSELPAADAKGMYVFSYTDIAPHMMGDVVTAKLYVGGQIIERDISVFAYCNAILKNAETYGDELAELAMELLDYGAATQEYVAATQSASVVSTDLANYRIAAAYPAVYALCNSEVASESAYAQDTTEGATVIWAGAGLYLKDRIAIRYTFEAASVEGLKAVVACGGKEYTIDAFESAGEGKYKFYFDGLNPTQMRDNVVVTVKDGDGNAVSNALTYSIESYVADTVANADETLKTLVQDMLRYGDAAKAWADSVAPKWETVADVDFEIGDLAANYFNTVQGTGAAGTLAEDTGYDSSTHSLQVASGTRPKYYKAGSIAAGWYRISGYVKLNGQDASSVSVQPWVKNASDASPANFTTSYLLSEYIIGTADADGWSYFEVDIQHLDTAPNYQVVFNNNASAEVYIDNFKYERYLGDGQPTRTEAPVLYWEAVADVDFETDDLADGFSAHTGTPSITTDFHYGDSKALMLDDGARAKYYKGNIAKGWYRISGYVNLNGADASKVSITVWVRTSDSANTATTYKFSDYIIGTADANGWSYFEVDLEHKGASAIDQVIFNNNGGSGKTIYFDNFKYEQYLGEGQPEPTKAPAAWATVADVDFEFEEGVLPSSFSAADANTTIGSLSTTVGYNSSHSLLAAGSSGTKYIAVGTYTLAAGWYRISGYVKLDGANADNVEIQTWIRNASGATSTNTAARYKLSDCIIGPAQNGWHYFEFDIQHLDKGLGQFVFWNYTDSDVYFDNFKYEQYLGEGQP